MNRTLFPKALLAALGVALFGFAPLGSAQNFPERSVRLIVPFSAGTTVDVLARMIGTAFAEQTGQPMVIDNRIGANGIIAAEAVAKAPADGYTLFFPNDGMMAANPAMYTKLSYDPLKDFVPVTYVSYIPLVLVVHPSLPAKNLAELLALVRSKPGSVNFASGGAGSAQHLPMEFLMAATGTKFTHVPYKGMAGALTDVLAGHVPVLFAGVPLVRPHVMQGKLRAIAVSSARRNSLLPDVPTAAEAGVPGYEYAPWNGIVAPTGTPAPVIQRLHAEISKALANPGIRAKLAASGFEVTGAGPAEFGALIRSDYTRVGNVVRAAGVKAD